MLCILTLSAVIVGCGEYPPPELVSTHEFELHPYGTYDYWWEIVYINGELTKNIKKTFGNYREKGTHVHSLQFSDTGWFRHGFGFHTYNSPRNHEAPMIVEIGYTTVGRYKTRGNILTMTKASTAWDVRVILEPEAAWQEKTEGGTTLEALESDFATAIEKELQKDTLLVFDDDTQYTWQIENDQLTLSSPKQTIVLTRRYTHVTHD